MEGFWYRRPEDQWPPESVRSPDEFEGGARLNVVCTQTELPSSAQRKLVRSWCDVLPTLKGVEYLWFHSRVPQALFDAACAVPNLKGLYVKWSGIKSVASIEKAACLRSLHIGSSAGLQSIDPLARMIGLRWLGLENIKRVSCLEPLASLTRLKGLTVEGSMWSTQHVDTLAPIGRLSGLRYLSIINLRAKDRTLAPLFALRNLEDFHAALWWPEEEVEELRRRNRRLSS